MENDTTKFTNGIGHTYCPETGKFFSKSGKEIGSYDRKYGRTNIRGKEVKLHRYAVFLMTGSWPEEEVDHIDGNPHNNKWSNLRTCTRLENSKNRGLYKNNKLRMKGVFPMNSRGYTYYIAKIQVDNERLYLGCYSTPEEAKKVYDEHVEKYFGEFAREGV